MNSNRVLSELPIVTIAANSIIFDSDLNIRPDAENIIFDLKNEVCFFIFFQVDDEEDMNSRSLQIIQKLDHIIPSENILFCQTNIGRSPMARQLGSNFHIECDVEASKLNSLFCATALISDTKVNNLNVKFQARSLEELFRKYHCEIEQLFLDN